MLELKNDSMVFSFPEVHPSAVLTVSLVRTLRIPDDGKKYPLPPGLGSFPSRHVDDFSSRVPQKWVKHGGVMIPMYQSEAMWLKFDCGSDPERGPYPFAIKVATGKRSAVTGGPWTKALREKDYLVAPKQPWLDGYVVSDGVVRQFVAAPLGHGLTAEEQITGKAEFSGLQVEVVPMRRDCFERRNPPRPRHSHVHSNFGFSFGPFGGGLPGVYCSTLSDESKSSGPQNYSANNVSTLSAEEAAAKRPEMYGQLGRRGMTKSASLLRSSGPRVSELGLAPGGTVVQQVFEDPFGLADWGAERSRCFVHLLNSVAWRSVTGAEPPTVPFTSAEYARRGMPWYDFYSEGPAASGTAVTKALKGIAELEKEKGQAFLAENESTGPVKVVKLARKGEVRDGVWK
jgi:hypothetical protein